MLAGNFPGTTPELLTIQCQPCVYWAGPTQLPASATIRAILKEKELRECSERVFLGG